MAARVLQRRGLAPSAAAAVAGSFFFFTLRPREVHAQAPPEYNRKPIYDDFETTTLPSSSYSKPSPSSTSSPGESGRPRRPTPTDRLAVQIGRARLFVHDQALVAETALNSAMDSAFSLEQSFTRTVASLAPPRESGEKLVPGAIYVLVAAMAGSIITRNRNILFRAAAPFALGIGAAWVVLPVTTRNVADLTWTYERRFPALADGHVRLREAAERSWHLTRMHSQQGVRLVHGKVTGAREAVEGWVKKGK